MDQAKSKYHPNSNVKYFSLGMLAGMCMLSASLMIHNTTMTNESDIFATQSVTGPVDGICGSANGSTLFAPVTFNTQGLCKSGQISRIIMDEKNKKVYRNCIGDSGSANDRCESNLMPSTINNKQLNDYKTPNEVLQRNEERKSLWRKFRETSLIGK